VLTERKRGLKTEKDESRSLTGVKPKKGGDKVSLKRVTLLRKENSGAFVQHEEGSKTFKQKRLKGI